LIDNCTPAVMPWCRSRSGRPVGPGSTIGAAAVTNALKCLVAEKLTALGHRPIVLTSSYFIGSEAQTALRRCYDDYRARVQKVYGDCR
jgi:hypothetical protein